MAYLHIKMKKSWTKLNNEMVMPTFNYTRANYSVSKLLGIISSLWILRFFLPLITFPIWEPRLASTESSWERGDSSKFANLVIQISVFLPLLFSPPFSVCQFIQDHSESMPKICLENPGISLYISSTENDKILQMSDEIHLSCELRCDFLAVRDRAAVNLQLQILFHLEEVSRVELNNGAKYQPSFKWLQPEGNYWHICIQHTWWNDKLCGLTTVNC